MRINELNTDRLEQLKDLVEDAKRNSKGGKPTKSYCRNTPKSKMSASWLSSCKAQGFVARDTGKTQKIGNKRVKLGNRRLKSNKYGGPVSPTKSG
jgi:hypothetical protein